MICGKQVRAVRTIVSVISVINIASSLNKDFVWGNFKYPLSWHLVLDFNYLH